MDKKAEQRGRPKLPASKKLKLVGAYLTDKEKRLIIKAHGSLSNAVRSKVLPELQ